ncbi:hypothetical protein [Leisingera sp. F5]|uniref:hypothetical protein n=1 Tax=Leisingera sp. F5 TaxID=1813816 RepID=UPI0025C6B158|nr:hypothetical protein [Leisingera sp. F5]
MVKIKHSETRLIDELFHMKDGFPLVLSNKTLAEFFEDEISVGIYDGKSSFKGTSKANRIRAFFESSSARQAAKLLKALWKHRNAFRDAEIQRRSELITAGFEDIEAFEVYCMRFTSEDHEFEELVKAIEEREQSEVIDATTVLASSFDFDTVMDEIDRARTFVDDDPEDATPLPARPSWLGRHYHLPFAAPLATSPPPIDLPGKLCASRRL